MVLAQLADYRDLVALLEAFDGLASKALKCHDPVPVGFLLPCVPISYAAVGGDGQSSDLFATGGNAVFGVGPDSAKEYDLIDGVHEFSVCCGCLLS
ncbi:MAG: hypothetical protein VX519_05975 [Myxococcota bacterium]|nr:hypothetical protein [Myxococcota bacterium]